MKKIGKKKNPITFLPSLIGHFFIIINTFFSPNGQLLTMAASCSNVAVCHIDLKNGKPFLLTSVIHCFTSPLDYL